MKSFTNIFVRLLLGASVFLSFLSFTGNVHAQLSLPDISGVASDIPSLVTETGTGGTDTATGSESSDIAPRRNPNETNPYAQLGPGGFDVRPAQPGAFTIPAYPTIEAYIVSLINFFLDFLGLIVLIMLIYGGYQYTTAFGDAGKLKKAKSVLTSALVGFFVVVIAFAIVSTIISATRRGVNECATPQAGICLSTSGGGVNFGIGTGIGSLVGSLF
ncbi:MAG: hypothetical protein A2V81_03665 [Candidatus Abawacabacteria bacterium RBG_16_42_10]|uniref:RDD domain-containing protein n=1 Tax=Candidatus Abawacabacteria bacterium RBG_16_42_10 TaxID=1817814 RepID=A0A1F4XJQ9_9BACT|nr:MAG: hypothetical protein A2V81_03665 [Candidatus Abawacabacteria bacterium RBG_16_42_10]